MLMILLSLAILLHHLKINLYLASQFGMKKFGGSSLLSRGLGSASSWGLLLSQHKYVFDLICNFFLRAA